MITRKNIAIRDVERTTYNRFKAYAAEKELKASELFEYMIRFCLNEKNKEDFDFFVDNLKD